MKVKVAQSFLNNVILFGTFDGGMQGAGKTNTFFIECNELVTVDISSGFIVSTEIIISSATNEYSRNNKSIKLEYEWEIEANALPLADEVASGSWITSFDSNVFQYTAPVGQGCASWQSIGYFSYGVDRDILVAIRIEIPKLEK